MNSCNHECNWCSCLQPYSRHTSARWATSADSYCTAFVLSSGFHETNHKQSWKIEITEKENFVYEDCSTRHTITKITNCYHKYNQRLRLEPFRRHTSECANVGCWCQFLVRVQGTGNTGYRLPTLLSYRCQVRLFGLFVLYQPNTIFINKIFFLCNFNLSWMFMICFMEDRRVVFWLSWNTRQIKKKTGTAKVAPCNDVVMTQAYLN